MSNRTSVYTKRRHHRNGDAVQVTGGDLLGLSNGDAHTRNKLAAQLVSGDVKLIELNVAQAAALACTTIAGVYDALRQLP